MSLLSSLLRGATTIAKAYNNAKSSSSSSSSRSSSSSSSSSRNNVSKPKTTSNTKSSNKSSSNKPNPYNELLYLKKQYESGNKGTQTWASNEAKKYYNSLDPNEAKKIQGMNASQLQNYVASNGLTNSYKPKPSASQLATPNKSGNDWSGVLINDKKATVDQARANNPLYDVNQKRQNTIVGAINTGDWTDYNNFQGQQDPLKYDRGQDGNYQKNKNYYADLIKSSLNAMKEAQRENDAKAFETWQNSLQERIQQYNNAPGMAVYIPQIHSSNPYTNGADNEWGIMPYDEGYMDSVYNQGSVGFKPHEDTVNRWLNDSYAQNPNINQYIQDSFGNGQAGGRMWYNNPYYRENPDLVDQAVEAGLTQGSEDFANQSWNINQNYYTQPRNSLQQSLQQYGQQTQQPSAPAYEQPSYEQPSQGMTQAEIDAYIQQLMQAYGQNQQSQQDAYMQQYQQYVQELMNWYRQMNEQNVYQNSINQYYNQRPQGQQSVYSPFI